jgi:AraC-like DNA-binding protein
MDMPVPAAIRTYGMNERSDTVDFFIRDETGRPPITEPHRHEYFQVQICIAGDTEQYIGGAVRPFRRGYVSFVLPYRVHYVPHPPHSRFVLINATQSFLRPDLDVDPLDLEDVPVSRAPELAPFIYQEYLDFVFGDNEFRTIEALVADMMAEHRNRGFGSLELLRGYLLQLLGLACRRHEAELTRLFGLQANRTSRRDSLQRVIRYVRENLHREIALSDAAAAAFLSPNYLAHLLKKETGKTFTELVTERRFERARELLATTDQRIGEIAYLTGFRDEAYFSRRFRQWFDQSPRAFRDSVRARVAAPGRTA